MKLRSKPLENSWIYYLLIVFACMNFVEQGAVMCLLLGWYCFFRYPKLEASGHMCVIAILVATICITTIVFKQSINEIIKAANYILLYIAGRNGLLYANNKVKFLKNTLFCVFVGFLLQLSLDYFYNYDKIVLAGQRTLYSIWTKEYIAVTLIGLLSAAIIGYSFYGIVICKRKIIKALCAIAMLLSISVNLSTATRTPIILTLIVFTLMLFIYLAKVKRTGQKKLFFGLMLILLIAAGYYADVGGVRSYFEASALFERFLNEGVQTGRWEIARNYWNEMPNHLFGGGHIKRIVGMEAHNYLQQSYDLYGAVAFISLLLITYHFVKNIRGLLKRTTDLDCALLMLGMFFSLLIQCCLEPIITGYPICLWMLMMIDGMATSMNMCQHL